MNIVVQKFGGTSLASPSHILNVAQKILRAKNAGKEVVVVVSAMAKETDRLLELTSKISKQALSPEVDLVASTGETITSALLCFALQSLGQKARSFLCHELPILTDSTVSAAQIQSVNPDRILHSLQNGVVPVIAGFQGLSPEGRVTTLGRGGSDTTAVAVAAALSGASCEIYTDVEGVYSADPKVCEGTKLLSQVSYDFMIEAARLGAKVMHDRSVVMGQKYNVPIEVRSSFFDKPGSLISERETPARCVAIARYPYESGVVRVSMVGNGASYDEQREVLGLLKQNKLSCFGVTTRKMSWSCFVREERALPTAQIFHQTLINHMENTQCS